MKSLFSALCFSCFASFLIAEEAPEPLAVVVVLPEQIGEEQALGGNNSSRMLVQAEVEKALIRSKYRVIDVNSLSPQVEGSGGIWSVVTVQDSALKLAKEAGADYLVHGKASAVKAGSGSAYGISMVQSQADVTARLIRVSDGEILTVITAEALEGNQSFGIAAKEALKKAGKDTGRKLVTSVKKEATE